MERKTTEEDEEWKEDQVESQGQGQGQSGESLLANGSGKTPVKSREHHQEEEEEEEKEAENRGEAESGEKQKQDQQQQQQQQPAPITSLRFWMRMATDAVLLIFGYLLLVAPPDFVSNSITNLGLAELATRTAAPPVPFFIDSRWVDDYFSGDIYSAFEEAQNHQDAFFLFYAPWDADSMRAREALEAVSDVFEDHSRTYFAAVNCWTAVGDCYREFGAGKANAHGRTKDEQQLPILVFYPRDRRGIQYFGPVEPTAMIQFLHNAQNPLSLVHSRADLVSLRASSATGSAVVGYFPDLFSNATLSGGKLGIGYRRFLHAAYELLETDPFRREVGPIAAVVSPKAAFQLQLSQNLPVRYFHWNVSNPSSSVAYPNKTITSAASLVKWIFSTKPPGKLTTWVGAINRKSLFLSDRLSVGSGKSLLLFTRRRLDMFDSAEAGALRETALKYFSCQPGPTARRNNDELADTMASLAQHSDSELDALIRRCLMDPWFERHYCRVGGGGEKNCVCQASCFDNRTLSSGTSGGMPAKYNFRTAKPTQEFFLKSAKRKSHGGPIEDVSVHNAAVSKQRLKCAMLAADPRACQLVEEDPSKQLLRASQDHFNLSDEEEVDVFGLGCIDNRTLNFYMADMATQSALARQIGVSTESLTETGSAVIVDLEMESVYSLPGGVSSKSLAEFVTKFHSDVNELSRLRLNDHPKLPGSLPTWDPSKESSIEEVTSSDFHSRVLNSTSNVLLLYTSRSCGACASFAYVFHSVQRILKPISDTEDPLSSLEFFMVDAGANDLPWHFSALTVPSVLFLPAAGGEDRAETRAFPSSKAMNVTNLLNFAIANLPLEARFQLSLSLCDDDCLMKSRVDLAQKFQESSLQDETKRIPNLQALDRELRKAQATRRESNRADKSQGRTTKIPMPDHSSGGNLPHQHHEL